MSRNFELMTQLGLQVSATDNPKPAAIDSAGASDVVSTPSGDAVHAGEEEMARFILEMFPRSGVAPKA
ncbi:MAG: hypothetical protein ABSE36_16350 [Terracidiphilus sp.]|jgi:hypothetical protein